MIPDNMPHVHKCPLSGPELALAADTLPALLINEKENGEAVIIGGMVLDIHATPSIHPAPRTTTPGKVHYAAGGVARNIAECVSKLGTKPFMISALGSDMSGEQFDSGLGPHGLNTMDVWLGICYWSTGSLQDCQLKVTFASPNEDELIAMANALSDKDIFSPIQKDGIPVTSLFQQLKPAIWVLLEKGIKVVILTLGSKGVLLCSKHHLNFQNIGPNRTRLDLMQSIAVGIAAAKATVEAEANVPTEYSLEQITADARTVYLGAMVVFSQSML
ncbi:hypothetical protein CTI12_AA165210 [Artemisia annua]|uniref:Carbohydrate kinase PfkB domain-containing protein n=1 Tax=Artemisia annua TaxID=35608 RepID=A0A2U1PCW4_ARTAN|nr:hypothetical protein CTI12_AA165210 [Artemisia annua]